MAETGDVAHGPLDDQGRPWWTLYCGPWEYVLPEPNEPHVIITDTPYSARTHKGHDTATDQVRGTTGQRTRRELDYDAITPETLRHWVGRWSAWGPQWLVVQLSHDLAPAYEEASELAGRYTFAPVPIVQKRPRLLGDGPANWCVWKMTSRLRTREAMRWRCLPGLYESHCEKGSPIVGAKPVSLMREIVRDYSDPHHLVVDPCAGWGTALLAAVNERRRAVGAEQDPERFEMAVKRLRDGGGSKSLKQVEMFSEVQHAGE